jgi:uncharacterized damage-inducible protein DinB
MTDTQAHSLGKALIDECIRRLYGESLPRLRKCLDQLDDTDLWYRPNYQTVGVGNLVLHLCGNVRQWICTGLGGQPDARNRESEFSEEGPIPKTELLARLEQTLADARAVIEATDPAKLLDLRRVQGFDESGLNILVHVVEHFSYHTGQITYIVKSRKAVDMGYYSGVDLSKKGQ